MVGSGAFDGRLTNPCRVHDARASGGCQIRRNRKSKAGIGTERPRELCARERGGQSGKCTISHTPPTSSTTEPSRAHQTRASTCSLAAKTRDRKPSMSARSRRDDAPCARPIQPSLPDPRTTDTHTNACPRDPSSARGAGGHAASSPDSCIPYTPTHETHPHEHDQCALEHGKAVRNDDDKRSTGNADAQDEPSHGGPAWFSPSKIPSHTPHMSDSPNAPPPTTPNDAAPAALPAFEQPTRSIPPSCRSQPSPHRPHPLHHPLSSSLNPAAQA